ncbi:transcriptional regulator, TetR family protein [Marinomonas sp. MED121]|nr:transcriptional regulator, TetR family protein [Marinomonas sp. MED121]
MMPNIHQKETNLMPPAKFDREQVLRSAMNTFVQKGYSKTSMQDLTKSTGLHPGSIYCAFENKRGLLLAALLQYKSDSELSFEAYFSHDLPVLQSLKLYLDSIVVDCAQKGEYKACLLTRALTEIADQDDEVKSVISESLYDWQKAFHKQFELAVESKELSANCNIPHMARYLSMGIYGLRTFAQTQTTRDVLQELADQLFDDIRRLSLEPSH